MLQNLREHAQGWIAGVIVGLLCIAFALWGIEYYISGNQTAAVAAKVNGHEINQTQVDSVYKRLRQQFSAFGFMNLDQHQQNLLKTQALEKLINQTVLSSAAEKAGYNMSNPQIASLIMQIPAFQINGQFSPALFQRAITGLFPSEQAFLNDVKQTALILQAKTGITDSAFLLPDELNRAVNLMEQKRDFSYLIIPTTQFLKTITISDAKILAYYKSHQENFMQAPMVKIEYIELAGKDFADKVTVTEPEIEQYYQENKAAYSTPEQWQMAEIVINVPDQASESTITVAQGKIDAIAQKLKQNQDFTTLAIQYSDDKTTAVKGGMLGWVDRAKQPAELVQAVANLQPGEISVPFRTAEGFAIVKLLAIKPPIAQPLSQVHEQVANSLRQQKVQQMLSEASDQLVNLTYTNPDTLKIAADTLKLPIQTTDFFTQQGAPSGIAANPKLVTVAFSDSVLKQRNNSDLISLDDQSAVVLRVAEYEPASLKPLVEVRPIIESTLKADATKNAAQEMGKKILADLKQGVSMDEVQKKNGFTWTHKENVGRNTMGITTEILQLAFNLPPATSATPSFDGVSLANGDYAILALTKIESGDPKTIDPQELQKITKTAAQQYGDLDYYLYSTEKMQNAKIKLSSGKSN